MLLPPALHPHRRFYNHRNGCCGMKGLIMLEKPEFGWSQFRVGDFSSRVSYLTDVASDILEALIEHKRDGKPTCVFCDAEGYDFHIIFSYIPFVTVVGFGDPFGFDDGLKAVEFWVNENDVAKEVYWDIKNNLSDWVLWDYFGEPGDPDYESSKITRAACFVEALDELAELYDINTNKS